MPAPVLTVLDCGDRLDRSVLDQRRAEWLTQLDAGGGLCLDTGRLAAIDAAGLQLLLAAEQECKIRGRAFTLNGPSGALNRAARRLGLAEWEAIK